VFSDWLRELHTSYLRSKQGYSHIYLTLKSNNSGLFTLVWSVFKKSILLTD